MLFEKAYAKLHGCYEALVYGIMENTISDLTPAAHIGTIKCDLVPPEGAYTNIWQVMEQAIEEGRLIAAGRYVQDPYSENVDTRMGIDLGMPYQILDVCAAKSLPSENLDALTVAMVCVRVLHPRGGGLFSGRWCRGHSLWVDYPDIGKALSMRTEEILIQLGLMEAKKEDEKTTKTVEEEDDTSETGETATKKSGKSGSVTMKSKSSVASKSQSLISSGSQSKSNSASTVDKKSVNVIEDAFADIRLKAGVSDGEEEPDNLSKTKRPKSKHNVIEPDCDFICWIQFEDFVSVFNRVYIVNDISWIYNYTVKRFTSTWVVGDFIAGSGGPPSEFLVQKSVDDDIFGTPRGKSKGKDLDNDENSDDNDDEEDDDEDDDSIEERGEPFSDNPMYPFSVTEPTDLSICLYQADKRWSAARVADDPLDICVEDYATRGGRRSACMTYPYAIGFVVLKLFGLKMRVTTFKMKKIVASSYGIVHSSSASNFIRLLPGRYAIVPFTHEILQYSTEYILFCQFKKSSVEFEINDILKERPIDTIASEDEDDLSKTQETLPPSGTAGTSGLGKRQENHMAIPEEAPDEPWLWREDFEEMGILSVYEQVGDLAKQLRMLRNDMTVMQLELDILKSGKLNYNTNKTTSF
jgi:hypothetical protein